jgi:hypothetical protein
MLNVILLSAILMNVVAAFHVILKAEVLFNVCREIVRVIPQENIKV